MGNGRRTQARKERREGWEKLTEEMKEAKMAMGEDKKRKELQEQCKVNLGDKRGERLGRESEKGTLMKHEPKGGILPYGDYCYYSYGIMLTCLVPWSSGGG